MIRKIVGCLQFGQSIADFRLQSLFNGLPAPGQPGFEIRSKTQLIEKVFAANRQERFCRLPPPAIGKRPFQIREIGLHASGIDANPATRDLKQIAISRSQQFSQIQQTLPQASSRLGLKAARP
ncbi:MAG: hypothetical protein GW822_08330 [Sphingomonadales bacterium]|nr:hypothetical protein [Sphingomonadales bacterium]NCP00404.1 hypothetical protein [Sphingomonadales bacterium]NCP26784.1 hypothetical protein [Sphingomonadales bacterium]NCP43426.1 hypothetical protein [Sphingomonadales bacterium]NCP48974.1 hypothetical protein [Sphingomonadales bacterium]